MNKSKKLVIFTLVGALLLAVGVYAVVSLGGSGSDTKYTAVKAGDPVLGSWSTSSDAEKADSADLGFTKEGKVSGHISGYAFSGTFKKKADDSYVIFNKSKKKTYNIDISGDTMNVDPVSTTLSVHWTLTAD